jgi:alpha-amylase
MPSLCLVFHVHQPLRLKRYTYLNVGHDQHYFDEVMNRDILKRVAEKCYVPANTLLLELIKRSAGRARVAFSISGVVLEQLIACAPQVVAQFQELAKTGCVEFLGETYFHSLASLYHPEEFATQVRDHSTMIEKLFGVTPRVFRNTELIYSDDIGALVSGLGFQAVIAEGVPAMLGWRSPNVAFQVPGKSIRLLLRNSRLSDDIAFRFSDRRSPDWPITTDSFLSRLHDATSGGDFALVYVDYESFGEHQWADTGIFEFLSEMPRALLAKPEWDMATPGELIDRYLPLSDIQFPRITSWADEDRDLGAWRGNRMQQRALADLYELTREPLLTPEQRQRLRYLQTSDHLYYMSTKGEADGEVHSYFRPYESPYDAFINYMNVLRDFSGRVQRQAKGSAVRVAGE